MIVDPVAAFGDFLTRHSIWGAPTFGLLAFGKSFAVIIPARPLLFPMGTSIGNGRRDPLSVLICAIRGAIVGYWPSWAIGRRIGHRRYHMRAFRPIVAGSHVPGCSFGGGTAER